MYMICDVARIVEFHTHSIRIEMVEMNATNIYFCPLELMRFGKKWSQKQLDYSSGKAYIRAHCVTRDFNNIFICVVLIFYVIVSFAAE